MMPRPSADVLLSTHRQARFWSKVQKSDGCWQWTGCVKGKGYGTFSVEVDRRSVFLRAHRVAWELTNGPIPDGLVVDHLCRNRACLNPAHMELVSSRVNTLRGVSVTAECAKKTHCKRGHELAGDNLGFVKKGRFCRACKREQDRK